MICRNPGAGRQGIPAGMRLKLNRISDTNDRIDEILIPESRDGKNDVDRE